MKQIPYWGSTGIRHHSKMYGRHSNLAPGICAPLNQAVDRVEYYDNLWIGKETEESGSALISGAIRKFVWRYLQVYQPFVRIVGLRFEHKTSRIRSRNSNHLTSTFAMKLYCCEVFICICLSVCLCMLPYGSTLYSYLHNIRHAAVFLWLIWTESSFKNL
jgi:hypothetical protein